MSEELTFQDYDNFQAWFTKQFGYTAKVGRGFSLTDMVRAYKAGATSSKESGDKSDLPTE